VDYEIHRPDATLNVVGEAAIFQAIFNTDELDEYYPPGGAPS
jgi:hypothetical protein